MYIVRTSSKIIAGAIHAKTAKKALELARPHFENNTDVKIEKDGLVYDFKELELIVDNVKVGDDA